MEYTSNNKDEKSSAKTAAPPSLKTVGTTSFSTTTTTTSTSTLIGTTGGGNDDDVPAGFPQGFPQLPQIDPHTIQVIWRDCFFLLLGCIAVSIIGFVETHAMDSDARLTSVYIAGLFHYQDMPLNPHGIVDTGFILTYPLYEYLKDHRDWNDWLAALNSIILILPTIYITYVTVWKGDYSCVFRVLALQLLRACCGWMTYLPPDPTYLNSNYDFPDFVQCLFHDCQSTSESGNDLPPEAQPFVSFFSGHVATMVVVGNHMALSKSTHAWAVWIHILNAFQIIRLLATRGHYSIDMIIGWYVAVHVTNPAGRLGRYYSRGVTVHDLLPKTPQEAFDAAIGVSHTRRERRMSALMNRPEVQEALLALQQQQQDSDNNQGDDDYDADNDDDAGMSVRSETTAKILQETAAKMLQEHSEALQEEIQHLQQQAKQTMLAMRERSKKLRTTTTTTTGNSKKEQ